MSILLRVKAARTIATLSQGRSATLSQVESTVNLRSVRGSAESLLWGGTARHPAEAGCLQDACKAPLQPWRRYAHAHARAVAVWRHGAFRRAAPRDPDRDHRSTPIRRGRRATVCVDERP